MRLLIGLVLESDGVLDVQYPFCGFDMVNSSVLAKSGELWNIPRNCIKVG